MNSYVIHYKQIGSDKEQTTRPIQGTDRNEALADFKRNALDPFTVVKIEQQLQNYLVAYGGEYARIEGANEIEALEIAQTDYEKNPCDRVEDWKDSEHTAYKWDVTPLRF